MSKRFKPIADLTPDELYYYNNGKGTIPELDEDADALREAGYDPETRRPLAEVEAESAREAKRAEEMKELEEVTVEEHLERQRASSSPPVSITDHLKKADER